MGQYANIKDAFLHCDVDKLILEYCKIPDGESSKVTIERASAEVHAAMERINQTEPEKTEKQNLLIVCKTYEENGEDTFCVEADDIAEWKKRRASKSEQPEEIGDEMLTFMDTDAIFDAAKAVDVPTKYAIEFCEWKDNLDQLTAVNSEDYGTKPGKGGKKSKFATEEAEDKIVAPNSYAQYLFDSGKIEAQAMEYMRGRSIRDRYMIIDEAQNMTPL